MKMRIVIADIQLNVRIALRALLARQPGLEVVGEAADARGVLAQVAAMCPDLVLLHWRLRDMAGSELVLAVRQVCPSLMVIVLSGRPEVRHAALAAGADAFMCKMDPPDRLLELVGGCRRRWQALQSDVGTSGQRRAAEACQAG